MPNNQASLANGGQEVKIADNLPGAEYTNLAQFNHNKEEFQLAFLNIAGQTGRVVSKIVTTPAHFKRMVSAMQDNLKKYEEAYGKVDENQDAHLKPSLKKNQ